MQYFIASSWTNMKQVQYLTENLTSLGHSVFSYVADERNFVPEKEIKEAQPFQQTAWQQDQKLRQIFEHTLEGIRSADTVILLLPAGNNSHMQTGTAYGLGKHLIVIGDPKTAEPFYLAADETYPTIEAYIALLKTTHA